MILTTKVFEKNLDAFYNAAKLIVNQGGQGSSKTYSVLQLLYFIAKKSKKSLIISVCSYALPHLKGGAIRDFENILKSDGVDIEKVRNKSDWTYHINNSIVEFFGIVGNESKATGPRRDILYVNEANRKVDYDVFELMNARTHKCTFLDYNPRAEFWYHTKIKDNFEHVFIKSTFLDNIYLPEREVQNILSKKNKKGFENWWKVYGLGELGQVEGAIFNNWSFGEFNSNLAYGYGLDFGVRDMDGMIKCAIDKTNKKIYLKEEIYQNGLSTDNLFKIIQSRNVGQKLIVADSAGTRTILDFKNKGLNIRAVEKGKIIEDIKMLMDYELIVDNDSFNLQKELNTYVWVDERGEIPIDENNHLLDPMRYYCRTILNPIIKRKGMRVA